MGEGERVLKTQFRQRIDSFLNAPPGVLAIAAGILLALSFPHPGLYPLAWIALMPLLRAIRLCDSKFQAFRTGFLAGLVFFGLSIHWLTYVAIFGWIFVICLESFFAGLFALAVYEGRKIRYPLFFVIWTACAWCLLEWARAEVPVFGFGWNLLAYSQAPNLILIQAANTVGAYGLGWVIAAVNVAVEGILSPHPNPLPQAGEGESKSRKKHSPLPLGEGSLRPYRALGPEGVRAHLGIIALLLTATIAHGIFHLSTGRENPSGRKLRVAVLQGNIPQELKWNGEVRGKIINLYAKLTELASFDNANLILWPEASFPGYLNRDIEADRIRDLTAKIGVPVLIGSPHLEGWNDAYNSAYLLDAGGEISGRYDKQRLVPFGEYVPVKRVFGFLEPMAYRMGVSDFQAGNKPTVFNFMNGEFRFSVLICFEDTFPSLAREFTARGAEFLTVITNDAWFGPTGAPYQHLQASVFRAVENGVAVVRAANTGVSAFITRQGKVTARVRDEKGHDIFSTGKVTELVSADPVVTLYRRAGWIFPYFSALAFAMMLIFKRPLCGKKHL